MKKFFLSLTVVASLFTISCVEDDLNPDALIPEKEPEKAYDYTQLRLNEISGIGEDDEKFIEIYNMGDEAIDLAGVTIYKDEEESWKGTKGKTVPAKGVFTIIGAKRTNGDDGFSSGLSAKKTLIIQLKDKDGKVIDTFQRGEKGSEWGADAAKVDGSWSRIPDGTGKFKVTETTTPGKVNATTGADDSLVKQ